MEGNRKWVCPAELYFFALFAGSFVVMRYTIALGLSSSVHVIFSNLYVSIDLSVSSERIKLTYQI